MLQMYGSWNARSTAVASRRRSRGLTLMELVVVLAVLAAVASIVAPLLPNLLRRAHKATDATQTSEISKAVQTYQAAYMSYPDNFDLLTAGTTSNALSYLPADGGTFGGFVITDTLTEDEAKALARVGVEYVQPLTSTTSGAGFHPTMNPYPSGTITTTNATAVTTSNLNFLLLAPNATIDSKNPSFLQAARYSDPTARFVVFGVGPRSSMVGTIIQDAPMSVPQNKSFTPDTLYSRVGVIFKVSGLEVERSERARFVAAVAMEDDELESTEKDIVGYYQVARDPRN